MFFLKVNRYNLVIVTCCNRTDFTDVWTALQFFCVSFFSFSHHYFLPFEFFLSQSLISPINVCFFILIFLTFSVAFKAFFLFLLVYVLD